MLQRLASMELSFEDGETVYVGHVDDVDVILDITLDDNNNVQQLNPLKCCQYTAEKQGITRCPTKVKVFG